MAHIEVEGTPKERPNTEASTQHDERVGRWLKIATVVVSTVNLAYIVATAVLIGLLIGWYYSIHCFVLCLLIIWQIIKTVRTDKKLEVKNACWESCTTLVLVLMTTFTLLTRQVYYHPSSLVEPKWILFFLQASIIPLLVGILVMYECSIRGLYEDRFILMMAILDFADIWDMVSVLSQHKPPYLKEESPLEITVQVFCSFSFSLFSVLILSNISHEGLKLMFKNQNRSAPEQDEVDQATVQKFCNHFCLAYAQMTSQLNQNIPFLVIRILIAVNHGYIDFDYLAKNVISVFLWFLDCCGCGIQPPERQQIQN